MGKKRIITKEGATLDQGLRARSLSRATRQKVSHGVLHIEATYNNTKVSFADIKGNVLMWSSSGALGFKGAKKGTPYAAAKVGELMGEKAAAMGVKDCDVVIVGVGAGRESSVRAFLSKGIGITSIQDNTPIPHNGPRPKKARRV